MKQFELQKPISQLFNALKSHFLCVNFFQIGCSEQSNKPHNFRGKKSFLWCHHFRTLLQANQRYCVCVSSHFAILVIYVHQTSVMSQPDMYWVLTQRKHIYIQMPWERCSIQTVVVVVFDWQLIDSGFVYKVPNNVCLSVCLSSYVDALGLSLYFDLCKEKYFFVILVFY